MDCFFKSNNINLRNMKKRVFGYFIKRMLGI